jgi:hypothetical protein|tara:strand:- start:275 stop:619 length:345 start_codon:yes stop_codon:yes gene_type:complete
MKDSFDLYSWNKKRYLKEGINDRISRINVVYTTFGQFYGAYIYEYDSEEGSMGVKTWNKKLRSDDTNALLKYLDIKGEFPFTLRTGDDKELDDIIKQLKAMGIDAEWDDYMDVS